MAKNYISFKNIQVITMSIYFYCNIKKYLCMHKVDLTAVTKSYHFLFSLSALEFCSSSSFFSFYHLSFGSFFMFSLFLSSSFPVCDSNAASHLSCYIFPFTFT